MKTNIKAGVVGIGQRGRCITTMLSRMPDVEVAAVCDVLPERAAAGAGYAEEAGRKRPAEFTDYREMIAKTKMDLIVITSSWADHSSIAATAMKAGIYTAMEVGGASSVYECFNLIKTAEETGTPFFFMENACYCREYLAITNIARQGLLGEIVHCGCGYIHDIRYEIGGGRELKHYRLDNYLHRNAENYPTHGIGPIAKLLNINYGNRFVSLTSMSSKARGMEDWVKTNLPPDHEIAGKSFNQGDIVTTLIKCAHGETVLCTLATSVPRPHSPTTLVQGSKGIWIHDGMKIHVEGRTEHEKWDDFHPYMDEFDHRVWKEIESIEGDWHGGIDSITIRALIDSVRNNTPPPIDVYDAATWMVITALSEESIIKGSAPVSFPDFTGSRWVNRKPKATGIFALE